MTNDSREAFDKWKKEILPNAGAVIWEIAYAAWQAAVATRTSPSEYETIPHEPKEGARCPSATSAPAAVDDYELAKIAAAAVLRYENAQGCAGKSSPLDVCKIAVEAIRPHIAEREGELRSALKTAKALTRKYIDRVNFEGLGDREITELREIHYQAEQALARRTEWVPKSQCEWDEKDKTMQMPEWLAEDKGFI